MSHLQANRNETKLIDSLQVAKKVGFRFIMHQIQFCGPSPGPLVVYMEKGFEWDWEVYKENRRKGKEIRKGRGRKREGEEDEAEIVP